MNSQSETEKEKLAKSKILVNFVKDQRQTWNHDEWLGLLAEVRKKGYSALPDDEIGLLLEAEKARQLNPPVKAVRKSKKVTA